MTDTGTNAGNDHSLQTVLGYILSREGLEQNLDLALNMTEEGNIPIQVIIMNSNVSKLTSDFNELVQVNFFQPEFFYA